MRSDARWTAAMLAYAAVLMAWSARATLLDRFEEARACLGEMFPSRRRVGRTYQGFIKALRVQSEPLLAAVKEQLRGRVRALGHGQVEGWRAFAVDGSKIDACRTSANEGEFGSGREGPKQWLTTRVQMGLGLPWDWRTGGADAAERTHLREMVGVLPEGCLRVADAGFAGYELLHELARSGRRFLFRVGSNVRLLRKLGYAVKEHGQIVYLWPRGKREAGRPPLTLRRIVLHDGRKEVHLVTDVLEAEALSDAAAARLYRRRWGVEVFYRSLKQTLNRRKIRSGAPEQARVELHWTMVGLWMLGLMGVEAVIQKGQDPLRLSVAGALRVVRRVMRTPRGAARRMRQLGDAVLDGYERKGPKAARDWPHKKNDRPPGPPKIRDATPTEVLAAQQLRTLKPAA